jgi:hypothetical protein
LTVATGLGLGPTEPAIKCIQLDVSTGVKRPNREANHYLSYSAGIKNVWKFPSTYLYDVIADFRHNNHPFIGDISGSHGDEYEDDCLLGCCAA